MIIENKHELGEMVRAKLAPEREMQITAIKVFMDGGYVYICSWVIENGGLTTSEFFPGELVDE